MSKKEEEKYKRYLYNNFRKILNYIDDKKEYSDDWYDELISYNNIIGSLIGLIDSKGNGKDFQNCKDFVLRYYEFTYPEKQLDAVDNALFSEKCYEYIEYASKNLISDKKDLKILKEFCKAYLEGYNLGNQVTLKSILPYYAKKINEYSFKLSSKNKEKLYQI